MKIFVVSLKGSPRRKAMQNQMAKLGIDFEFFDAVDGRNGVPKEYEHLIDKKAIRKNIRRDMADGEIGCALSHKLLYDKIVERKIEHTVILEDDAIIDEDFKEVLEAKVLEKDKMGFLFLYAGSTVVKKSSKQSFYKNYVSYSPLCYPGGAVAYYVNLKMALSLAKQKQRIATFADNWGQLDIATYKIVYPRLICHPPLNNNEQFTLSKSIVKIDLNHSISILNIMIQRIIGILFIIFGMRKYSRHVLREVSMIFESPQHFNFFRFIFWIFKKIWNFRDSMYIFKTVEDKY